MPLRVMVWNIQTFGERKFDDAIKDPSNNRFGYIADSIRDAILKLSSFSKSGSETLCSYNPQPRLPCPGPAMVTPLNDFRGEPDYEIRYKNFREIYNFGKIRGSSDHLAVVADL